MPALQREIKFANLAQVILFECEIKGQLSDGHWENSRPYNHWEAPCRSVCSVANEGERLGRNYHHFKQYDFASKSLLDVVADRMIGFVRVYTAYPNLDFNDHWDYAFDCGSGKEDNNLKLNQFLADQAGYLLSDDEYWLKRGQRVLEAFGCEDITQLTEAFRKVVAVDYNRKNLVKDLNEMKTIFNTNPTD